MAYRTVPASFVCCVELGLGLGSGLGSGLRLGSGVGLGLLAHPEGKLSTASDPICAIPFPMPDSPVHAPLTHGAMGSYSHTRAIFRLQTQPIAYALAIGREGAGCVDMSV